MRITPAKGDLRIHALVGLVLLAIASVSSAKPYTPASDNEILERLPYRAGDPAQRELRRLNEALRAAPNDVQLACDVARRHIEQGRATSDPRYYGYAQAALAKWWNQPDAPTEVLVLRATLHQNQHRFELALVDLDTVLKRNPKHAQARLTKAVVLQVRGDFSGGERECRLLTRIAQPVVTATCLAAVQSLNGELKSSYERLSRLSDQLPATSTELRGWMLSYLADMATRLGNNAAAEAHYRAALSNDGNDRFMLAAFADFLLDQKRPAEVLQWLRGQERVDGLLLRIALAERALNDAHWLASRDLLASRFTAARLRDERVHLREEARFTLWLQDQPKAALELALANWAVQKEPADARLVLEASRAAGRRDAAREISALLVAGKLEDVKFTN